MFDGGSQSRDCQSVSKLADYETDCRTHICRPFKELLYKKTGNGAADVNASFRCWCISNIRLTVLSTSPILTSGSSTSNIFSTRVELDEARLSLRMDAISSLNNFAEDELFANVCSISRVFCWISGGLPSKVLMVAV